ncbi:hypothetical protein ACDY97_28660 [Rhizobium mongolense]|uniref:hypothetical protein n=1 Tax=Rhizobium mongolense TaxID=57676 RepID=UPI003558388E
MDNADITPSGTPVGDIFNQLTAVRVAAAIVFTLSLLGSELTLASQTSDIVRVAEASGEPDWLTRSQNGRRCRAASIQNPNSSWNHIGRRLTKKATSGCAFLGSLKNFKAKTKSEHGFLNSISNW